MKLIDMFDYQLTNSNHLCVKGPDGVVSYVVLSTVPPEKGAAIIAPSYETKKEPVPVIILNKISAPITLWDCLKEDQDKSGFGEK